MSKYYFHVDDSEYYMVQIKDGELRRIKNCSLKYRPYLTYGMTCPLDRTEFDISRYNHKLDWDIAKDILEECLEINHEEFRTMAKKLKRGSKGYEFVDEIVSKKLKKVDKKEVKQLRKIKKKMQ